MSIYGPYNNPAKIWLKFAVPRSRRNCPPYRRWKSTRRTDVVSVCAKGISIELHASAWSCIYLPQRLHLPKRHNSPTAGRGSFLIKFLWCWRYENLERTAGSFCKSYSWQNFIQNIVFGHRGQIVTFGQIQPLGKVSWMCENFLLRTRETVADILVRIASNLVGSKINKK